MKIAIQLSLAVLLALPGWGRSAHAIDLWEQLKKAFQKESAKDIDKALPPALRGLKLFSDKHELEIGRQVAGNLLGAAPLVNDAGLQHYINLVGRWVASQSERRALVWRFGVIDSLDLNAFAVPGGYVFVTKGLYRLLQDESELAGVLAHEIGHISKKHHLHLMAQTRMLERGREILTEKTGENEQIQRLIGAGAEIFARALDKRAEYEADRIAVVLAARAGYDPFGLPVVLQDLGHVPREESRVALLFKTHPHPDDRLEQLDTAVGSRLDALKGARLGERFYRIKP